MKQKLKNNLMGILISAILLTIGISGALYFRGTKPQAQSRRAMSSMVPVVETEPFVSGSEILMVDCLGTVIAESTASLQAEVNGRIVAVNPDLVEGQRFRKGDLLVEIEDTDYRIALLKAEASLLTAESNLRIEEGQQAVVRHELELMGGSVSDSHRDLTLREPQLKTAQAAVKSAELAVQSAKLDLERTKLRAPFDAVVVSKDVDVGDYAQASRVLVELAATDRFFVRASVPLESLEALPNLGKSSYAAEIRLSDGTPRAARTYKLLPGLSEKGRMARILLVVDDPYETGGGRPLLLDEYVRVRIKGESAENASLIPRKYLRDGNVVWMIDSEDKLQILPFERLQGYADEMLVRIAGASGMQIVTTDLSAVVDGMQLRRARDRSSTQEGTPPESAGRMAGTDKQGA